MLPMGCPLPFHAVFPKWRPNPLCCLLMKKKEFCFLGRHIEGFSAGYSRGGIKYRSAEIGVDVDGGFFQGKSQKMLRASQIW